jgi:hypothetical protein
MITRPKNTTVCEIGYGTEERVQGPIKGCKEKYLNYP